jgi:hypothetical protein
MDDLQRSRLVASFMLTRLSFGVSKRLVTAKPAIESEEILFGPQEWLMD